MYSELHQNVHKISSSQITFFFNNSLSKHLGIFTHVCEHYLSESPLALGGACPCTDFLAMFHIKPCHRFSSFLHPWHHHNHHLNCLPWMMYPLYSLLLFFISRKYCKSSWMSQAAKKEIQLNTNSFSF